MKSQRLLEIVLRLQARSPRSAPELADLLGVTERTIYRDLDALSAAGVPIFTTRGVKGGIHLRETYRQSIAQLSDDEIRAVFIGGADPLGDLGWGEQLAPAREKLFGALADRQRATAAKSASRIRIESRPWGQSSQPTGTLRLLRIAVWDDRSIHVTYRNQRGSRSSRSLDPLGIVFKAGVWYLVAQGEKGALTLRVDRIDAIDLSTQRFIRPEDFKLDAYWQQASKRYENREAPCKVRVSGSTADIQQLGVFWPTEIIASADGGETLAAVTFPLRGLAIHELLAWSGHIVIVEPNDIRSEIEALLRVAVSKYRIKAVSRTRK